MPTDAPDLTTIAVLLDDVRSRRSGAIDQLIRCCRPFVERKASQYAWANTDPQDIVQDVWIELIQSVHRIREPRSLLGWLSVVTRHRACAVGRRNRRLVPTDFADDVASVACTEEQAISLHDRDLVRSGIREGLAALKDVDRQLLVLLHPAGAPNYSEISREVRRPVGSLGPTRRRLLNRLGEQAVVRGLRTSVGIA